MGTAPLSLFLKLIYDTSTFNSFRSYCFISVITETIMGIDKKRFLTTVEISIDKFLCGICKDVASNPILTNHCEHYICLECATAEIVLCPTCDSVVERFVEMGAALTRIYLDVKLKCIYDGCEELLTIGNHAQHELICPKGIFTCPNTCGFEIRLSVDVRQRQHNCIDVMKQKVMQMESIIDELRKEKQELDNKRRGE